MGTFISTKGRYAIRFLIDLAEHADEERIPLKDVAERQKISLKYLETFPNHDRNRSEGHGGLYCHRGMSRERRCRMRTCRLLQDAPDVEEARQSDHRVP